MTIVTIHRAKTSLSKLIEDASAGEDVVIARGAIPVARLVPINPPARRQFGAFKHRIVVEPDFFAPLPADILDAWEDPA
jgi:antitoxin (DNA-binding transcriptional repressor) of toxin-antitoxin stability system